MQIVIRRADSSRSFGRLLAAKSLLATLCLVHLFPLQAAPTLGDVKVLGVRVLFDDAQDAPSEEKILSLLNGAKRHFGNFSYDRLRLDPEVATVRLNNDRSTYSNSQMKNAAETKLTRTGYRLGTFGIIGFYPGAGGFGSHATVGGKQFVAGGTGGATLHEMGHNLGFKHQTVWDMAAGGSGPLARGDFKHADPYHFMSGSSAITPGGIDPEPYEKWTRDWITQRHKLTENGSRTVRLYTFDQKDTDPANGKRTLMVKRGDDKNGEVWCGFRSQLLDNNKQLRQGLVLYWHRSGASTSGLIDAHPWTGYGPFGTSDHALQPGETWSDPPGQIHITNLGRGGTAPNEYLDVRVNRGPFDGNRAPAPTWDAPSNWTAGVPLTITLDGNDPDGDEVACMWTTSNKSIPYNSSAGALTVTWNNPGYYDVKVEVSDMKGMVATRKKTILVRSDTAVTRTWDRGEENNLWHESRNWTGNTLPILDDTVAFDGRTAPALLVALDAATEVFDIQFSGSERHNLQSDSGDHGRNLSINGNIINGASANQVFRRNASTGNALFIKMSPGNHVFDTSGGDILVKTQLNGEGANLIKEGPHTLEFESWTGINPVNAPNNYDGLTTVREGTLALSKNDGVNAILGDLVIGDGSGTDIVVLRSNHQVANTSRISFDGASAIFRLNGQQETVGGIHSIGPQGAGIIENNHSHAHSVLTIASAADDEFRGVIRDGRGGTLGLVKNGANALTLSGASTYSGGTTVNDGILRVENTTGSGTGSGAVQVGTGALLGGDGIIAGPVTISAGATLEPGAGLGSMTIDNTLELQGTTVIEIGRIDGTASGGQVTGVSTLTCGGVLQLRDIGTDILRSGDTFPLFVADTMTGDFSSLVLPPLWRGLTWDTSGLTVDGTIRVTGSLLAPTFSAHIPVGTNVTTILEGSGGTPDFAYTLFSSTNLVDWIPETSELFDHVGTFLIHLPASPDPPRRFFMLQGHPALQEEPEAPENP